MYVLLYCSFVVCSQFTSSTSTLHLPTLFCCAVVNSLTPTTPTSSQPLLSMHTMKLSEASPKKLTTPTLTHILSNGIGSPVYGVTSVGLDLFVLRVPSQQRIEVFESVTFQSRPSLVIPDLSDRIWWGHAMAACEFNKCLYVSDGAKCVHRVPLDTEPAKNWFVDGGPTGLSVNGSHNVLVTCLESNKIREYTAAGDLVRIICLAASVKMPWHAVQLTSSQLVVSHSTPVANIIRVDFQGHVVLSFQSTDRLPGTITQNIEPKQLAVLKNGRILAADKANNRIVVLNSTLSSSYDLSLPVRGGIKEPLCVHVDELRGRLYISESEKGRILVFNNVFDVGRALN